MKNLHTQKLRVWYIYLYIWYHFGGYSFMVSVGTANIPYIECRGYFESISFKTFETNRYAFQQPFPEYNEKPIGYKML